MKHSISILICLLMLTGAGCRKRSLLHPVNELHYAQTHCSDPWRIMNAPPSDSALKVKLKEWLQHRNITVSKISLSMHNSDIQCDACFCKTGRKYQVVFNPADIEKAKSLGFYKP